MTIEKLPSGNYRISQMVDGKRYRTTIDHKPSKVEAMKIISDMIVKEPHGANMTVVDACKAYIGTKSNVLSPTTIRMYNGLIRAISDDFGTLYINEVTNARYQAEVNRFTNGHEPKTVSNFAHFIGAVLSFYDIQLKSPKLPQKIKKDKYIPTIDEVKAVINEVKDTKYEIFYRLAIMGLRRSETFALRIEDLSPDNKLTINKAMVLNDKREKVIKTTKTTDSARTLVIDDELANLIRKQGFIWEGSMDMPYIRLCQVQDKLGIQHFSLHTFRHFMVSYLHDLGYSDKAIQTIGGWRTTSVFKNVYEHAMNMDETKKNVSNDIASILS